MLTVTLVIVILTCIISVPAFGNPKLIDDLIFYPPAVANQNQWYRFFTCGFIHADAAHLIFNMFALYSFGAAVENGQVYSDGIRSSGFIPIFGLGMGKFYYGLMYVSALFFCLLPTYAKHKNNYSYRSLGASGAVSAVIFAGLLLEPRTGVGLLFIPVHIPGYIFGPLYLIISTYLAKKGRGNINHSAHIWGALYGMIFIVAAAWIFARYHVLEMFIERIRMDIGF
ncbi:MAG: rhomboid family intramembrane serine protease [Chitinophagaceae bacterium]